MTVQNILSYLREKPVEAESRVDFCISDYFDSLENKKFYFRQVVKNIQVQKNDPKFFEPLARPIKFGILEKSYYLEGNGSGFLKESAIENEKHLIEGVYLRKSILRDLKRVDQFLLNHSGGKLCLVILSGYRPIELQKACIEGVCRQERSEGAKPVSELFSSPEVYSPHATGGAFDVEIWSLEHSKILPTKFFDREETRGSFFLEDFSGLCPEEEEARKNRRLLFHLLAGPVVLGKNHFIAHPSEYWHFGRNERLSAFFCLCKKHHKVFYDVLHLVNLKKVLL